MLSDSYLEDIWIWPDSDLFFSEPSKDNPSTTVKAKESTKAVIATIGMCLSPVFHDLKSNVFKNADDSLCSKW